MPGPAFPRQPWESQGMLCIFDPIQAAFPLNLSLPYQGPQPGPGTLGSSISTYSGQAVSAAQPALSGVDSRS